MISSSTIAIGTSLVATGAIAAGVNAMIQPKSSLYGKVYWRADPQTANNKIALTFDDGPTEPSTRAILDTLGELNIKASFFVIGHNVQKMPKLLERIHAEGHLIGNHTFDHPWFGMLRGPWYWHDQIRKTDDLIQQIIGQRPAMFRPPMGVKTWFIHRPCQQSGHAMITWTRRGRDGVATTSKAILDRLIPYASSGDILLLHDGIEPNHPRDPAATVNVTWPLITKLAEKSLAPVRLDELLGIDAHQ